MEDTTPTYVSSNNLKRDSNITVDILRKFKYNLRLDFYVTPYGKGKTEILASQILLTDEYLFSSCYFTLTAKFSEKPLKLNRVVYQVDDDYENEYYYLSLHQNKDIVSNYVTIDFTKGQIGAKSNRVVVNELSFDYQTEKFISNDVSTFVANNKVVLRQYFDYISTFGESARKVEHITIGQNTKGNIKGEMFVQFDEMIKFDTHYDISNNRKYDKKIYNIFIINQHEALIAPSDNIDIQEERMVIDYPQKKINTGLIHLSINYGQSGLINLFLKDGDKRFHYYIEQK